MSRRTKELIWFAVSLLYAGGRILAANAYLTQYGLNIAIFATVELTSTVILAISSARVVSNFVDGHRAKVIEWFLLVLVGFATPDVYAFLSTDHLPKTLVFALVSFVIASGVWTFTVIRRDVRSSAHKRESSDTDR